MGAMGSATSNFYNAAFQRAGFEDDAKAIQQLWIDGKHKEAAERVPDAMVTQFGAVGTPDMIRERFQKYKDIGIDGITFRIEAPDHAKRMSDLEQVMDVVRSLEQ